MIIVILTTLWVTICSAYDLAYRRVPNELLGLGILSAALMQAASLLSGRERADATTFIISAAILLSTWMLAVIFWLASWWGAADAKFMMALSLAFPDLGLLLSMAIANSLAGLVALGVRPHPGKRLPAVAILASGWLAWAGLAMARGMIL